MSNSPFRCMSRFTRLRLLPILFLAVGPYAGLAQANQIGDFVWHDVNTNGVQDVGEPGLPGIPVFLYDTASNFIATTASDANGFYQFTNIANGAYFMQFVPALTFPYFITTNNIGDDNLDSDIDPGGRTPDFVYTGVAITNLDAGYVAYVPGIEVTKLASDGVYTAPDGTPLYVTNNTLVTYTYVITNTGNVDLSFVILFDDVLFPFGLDGNPFFVLCPDTFPPGGTITFTTQTVINASVTNIATVQAVPVNFKTCDFLDLNPVEDSDDAVVLLAAPDYNIDKFRTDPTNRAAAVGEIVEFTIVVTNSGDTLLETVPLEDTYETNYLAFAAATPAADDTVNDGVLNWANIGPLPAGASTSVVVSFTAVASTGTERLNIVVASPQTPTNVPGVPPKTNSAPYDVVDPSVSIVKTLINPSGRPAALGETNIFTITVANTGDITLDTVPVVDTYDTALLAYLGASPASDDNANDGTINWANVGPLGVGASVVITTRFEAVASGIGTNFVVTQPTTTNGIPVPPDDDPEGFTNVNPVVTIVKTLVNPSGRPAALGETNVFAILVSNAGDITLDTVPVEDTYDTALMSYVDSVPASDDNNDDGIINWANVGPLTVGASITITARFEAVASGIGTNLVVTEPTTTNGIPVPPDEDPEGYTNVNPLVSIQKLLVNPSGRPAAVGETNIFRIVILNSGDVPLDTVPLNDTYNTGLMSYLGATPASDDNVDDGSIDWTDLTGVGSLAVSDSIIVTTRFLAVASGVGTNLALTEPTTTNNIPVPPDEDPEGYTNVNPSVSIVKTLIEPAGRPAALGETNIFTIVVSNTGDITLDTVPVVDTFDTALMSVFNSTPPPDGIGPGVLTWNNVGPLGVGQSTTITTRFVAISSGIGTNFVNTSPTTTNGIPVPPDDDPEGFTNVNPAVRILKTLISPTNRPAALGETNVFVIQIANGGDVTLDTVPYVDTYDTALMSYIDSVPASDDNNDDGTINWSNVGPIGVGGGVTITSRFLAVGSGAGTNLVVVSPTTTNGVPVPPDEDPEGYTNVNPSVSIVKTLVSPTNRPAIVGETNVFTITVSNTGDVTLDVVPITDLYFTNLIAFLDASVPTVNPFDDGNLNWSNVGPIAVGDSVVITSYFRAASAGSGSNYVSTVPSTTNGVPVPPDIDDEGFTNITVFIGDTVWIDLNTNALPDEALNTWGLNNITVNLFRVDGVVTTLIDSATTGPGVGQQGYYAFTGLSYGVYISAIDLFSVPPLLAVQTTPTSYLVDPDATNFPPSGIFDTADFGLQSGSLTPIELESFTVVRTPDGVKLEWVTAVEFESQGFNILRQRIGDEERAAINADLIPAVGGENGAAYSFIDSTATSHAGYLYWLEEIATDGAAELYGPVAVHALLGGTRALAAAVVDDSGLFRIRYEALVAAGLPVGQINPAKLRVYVDGQEAAVYVNTEESYLQPGDYALFLADGGEVTVATSDENGVGMGWLYARPARRGDLGVATADETGAAVFPVDPTAQRMMVTGFTSPAIWLLDVTDPARPSLLFGQVVVESDNAGTYAVYFSVDPSVVTEGMAVQDDRVIDIDNLKKSP